MITTAAYPTYQNNPLGISFMGKKTWSPVKRLGTFVTATFGVPLRDQINLIGEIADAMFDIAPLVRDAMSTHADFQEIGNGCCLPSGRVSAVSMTGASIPYPYRD